MTPPRDPSPNPTNSKPTVKDLQQALGSAYLERLAGLFSDSRHYQVTEPEMANPKHLLYSLYTSLEQGMGVWGYLQILEGRDVGCILGVVQHPQKPDQSPVAFLWQVVVAESVVKQGICTRLMKRVLETLPHEFSKLVWGVLATNEPMLRASINSWPFARYLKSSPATLGPEEEERELGTALYFTADLNPKRLIAEPPWSSLDFYISSLETVQSACPRTSEKSRD